MPIANVIPLVPFDFRHKAHMMGMVFDESDEKDGVVHITFRDPQKVIDLMRLTPCEWICAEDSIELTKEEMFTS